MSAESVFVYGPGAVALSARVLNDTIATGAKDLGGVDESFDFFCECGDPVCRDVMRLTVGHYHGRGSGALVAHAPAS